MQAQGIRLSGSDLLRRVAELGGASKADKAKACGYFSSTADGQTRVNFTAFYEALALASGVPLEEQRQPKKPALSYRTSVLTTGAILIGPRYVEQLGLRPGDQVNLDVDGQTIQVCVAP